MYEEMSYEKIMEDMLEDVPKGLLSIEGSLIWNACSKMAARLEEAYTELDLLHDNLYPDTADLEHLILFGQEKGVYIEEATYATFKAEFNIAVPIGTEFTGDDYNYIVDSVIDEEKHIYLLECEDAGSEPNYWIGDLMCLDDVEGLEDAKLIALVQPGIDEEDEEAYRMRLLDYFGIKSFAGNRSYYIQEIHELDGVGGVKIQRRNKDIIPIYIMSDECKGLSEQEINTFQEIINPVPYNQDGDGLAPIGHNAIVFSVEEVQINIGVKIEYDTDYTYDDLKVSIETAIENYILSLCREWETLEYLIIRTAQIINVLLDVMGIVDVTEVQINKLSENLKLDQYQIPVKGEIVCN